MEILWVNSGASVSMVKPTFITGDSLPATSSAWTSEYFQGYFGKVVYGYKHTRYVIRIVCKTKDVRYLDVTCAELYEKLNMNKKFNKNLSQLEAMHQVAKPVFESAEPRQIADYVHHVCENNESYAGVVELKKESIIEACHLGNGEYEIVRIIGEILQENGHAVRKEVILEGLQLFRKDEES